MEHQFPETKYKEIHCRLIYNSQILEIKVLQ